MTVRKRNSRSAVSDDDNSQVSELSNDSLREARAQAREILSQEAAARDAVGGSGINSGVV